MHAKRTPNRFVLCIGYERTHTVLVTCFFFWFGPNSKTKRRNLMRPSRGEKDYLHVGNEEKGFFWAEKCLKNLSIAHSRMDTNRHKPETPKKYGHKQLMINERHSIQRWWKIYDVEINRKFPFFKLESFSFVYA